MDFLQSIDLMQLLKCFIVGGFICIIGQILIDKTKINLSKGVIEDVRANGLIGAFTGGLKASAGGIAAAVFFGYIASLVSKPKIKKQ